LAVLLVVALHSSPWLVAASVAVLACVLRAARQRLPRGELRGTPRNAGGIDWSWRDTPGLPWRPLALQCDYLGPWLIGLRLDGRRLWLWPDSSDGEALRRLRCELVSLP
jgi:hypothetical protein